MERSDEHGENSLDGQGRVGVGRGGDGGRVDSEFTRVKQHGSDGLIGSIQAVKTRQEKNLRVRRRGLVLLPKSMASRMASLRCTTSSSLAFTIVALELGYGGTGGKRLGCAEKGAGERVERSGAGWHRGETMGGI